MSNGADSFFADHCFKALCGLAFNGDLGFHDSIKANEGLRTRLECAYGHLCLLENDHYAEVLTDQLWHSFKPLINNLKALSDKDDDHLASIAQELISFVECFNRERGARNPETTALGVTQD